MKALTDSKMAALSVSVPIFFKGSKEAERATIEAIETLPPECKYLGYFYAGQFQCNEAHNEDPHRFEEKDFASTESARFCDRILATSQRRWRMGRRQN